MVSNGARKRLPLHSKSLKGEMGEMDAPFWLRLLTFGYARLRRATRIDILGWADFEARVPLRPGLTCTLNPPTELALGPEPFRGFFPPARGRFGRTVVPSQCLQGFAAFRGRTAEPI